MEKYLENFNGIDLSDLECETRRYFSQLISRLDRFRDNMQKGFENTTYMLEELNYRI